MILAAGLGTRLKPWTLTHPKALVPVGGIPMLERVIRQLITQGFDRIIINIHHFADQIIEFLHQKNFDAIIHVSDERSQLLDTGGGIVNARKYLCDDNEPFLVHNVDILSTANLQELLSAHRESHADATLLVSHRDSSRKLIIGGDNLLRGWIDTASGRTRPDTFTSKANDRFLSFSGIHVISPHTVELMLSYFGCKPFPIMDFYLDYYSDLRLLCHEQSFDHIDIGKPDTLEKANRIFKL